MPHFNNITTISPPLSSRNVRITPGRHCLTLTAARQRKTRAKKKKKKKKRLPVPIALPSPTLYAAHRTILWSATPTSRQSQPRYMSVATLHAPSRASTSSSSSHLPMMARQNTRSSHDGSRSTRTSKRYSVTALYLSMNQNHRELEIEDDLARGKAPPSPLSGGKAPHAGVHMLTDKQHKRSCASSSPRSRRNQRRTLSWKRMSDISIRE